MEAKLDKLPWQLDDLKDDLITLIMTLNKRLDLIEAKLDSGDVITQDDLAPGRGGVWIPGAKKMSLPPGPPPPFPPPVPPKP